MAAAAPTHAKPQALILQLQSQVATLTSGAAPAGPASAVVIFAGTPQSLHADDLIDYSTKWGSSIYEQGCKKTLNTIRRHYDAYLDSKLINHTHKALMTSTLCKYDWLRQKGQWGTKSLAPAHTWNLLAFVDGSPLLDTGQFNVIMYLFIFILPIIIISLMHSIFSKNPRSLRFLKTTILRGTPWAFRGHRGPIWRRRRKVKT